jgi:hypothetical protein
MCHRGHTLQGYSNNPAPYVYINYSLISKLSSFDVYLRANSVNEEIQRSHYSASTVPTRSFQYETSEEATLRTSLRCDAQVNLCE